MKFEYIWDEAIGPILYVNFINRKIGLCFCHRRKDRSIWFFGLENFFCSRCLGILLGFFVGSCYRIFFNAFPLISGFILMIPLVIDGFSQLLGHRESNNGIRLITGFLFGFGMTIILLFGD
jgi:uncharacterized membrane protein